MALRLNFGRIAAMLVVTAASLAVIVASGLGWDPTAPDADDPDSVELDKLPPAAVAIQPLAPESIAVSDTYSGMLQPWERYRVSFAAPGRIVELGTAANGLPIDDGSPVTGGQLLALQDTRLLAAQVQEATAMNRQAQDEYDRAVELKQVNPQAISAALMLRRETELEIAKAKLAMAEKNLADATLTAPTNGVISKRLVNVGESALPQQTAFEIVENQRLLLSVGVPESRIRAFLSRQREVAMAKAAGEYEAAFHVQVQMTGSDALGRRWQPVTGKVHRIGQTSDEMSGMFKVEVELDNREQLFRPGQIGVGQFEVAKINGFRLPVTVAVVRDEQLVIFYAVNPNDERSPITPKIDDVLVARAWVLQPGDYFEQDEDIVIRDLPVKARQVISRGQHRLVDGSTIKVTEVMGPTEMAPQSGDKLDEAQS